MSVLSYVSNLSAAWPVEKQRSVIAEAAQREALEYQDTLVSRYRKREWLRERARMLRQTSGESAKTIYVAALECLAISVAELVAVITAAAQAGATIEVVADRLTIPPNPPAAVIAAAVTAWPKQIKSGFPPSHPAQHARVVAALDLVRDDWLKYVPVAALVERSGLSEATLRKYLGKREYYARVAAALDLVRDDWAKDVPAAALVERSGLSEPTLYKHLGKREYAARVAAALDLVRDDWVKDVPVAALVERSGLSQPTLYRHLGKRSVARRALEGHSP